MWLKDREWSKNDAKIHSKVKQKLCKRWIRNDAKIQSKSDAENENEAKMMQKVN